MPDRDRDLIAIITDLPDISAPEIADLCPHLDKMTISYGLQGLVKRGKLVTGEKPSPKKRGKRTVRTYRIAVPGTKPKLTVVPKAPDNAELEELREFKRMALERYPDLAIDPIVLEARKIIAQFTDAKPKDDSPIMLATIAALEARAA